MDDAKQQQKRRRKGVAANGGAFELPFLDPFMFYWAGLTALGVTIMHLQVVTRFLCCCPCVYWFMSDKMSLNKWWRYGILIYCLSFWVFGIVLFVNFYPFT
jgi:hypothetical protein